MRTELYPTITPTHSGHLKLDDLHSLYWEESGNPEGIPVIFIHGGPGAGASESSRRFFDPSFYRIILYDQRGSGRSLPLGETRNNTTPHLIQDLETLRDYLQVDKWLLFGGSWGSTLSIAYAEHHPARCLGLVLRGLFLCRPSEIDWFLYGMKTIFPEAWQEFSGYIPASERSDLLKAYHGRLLDPNPAIHMPAALAWSKYEGACSSLMPNEDTLNSFLDPVVALGLARMEAHYFSNNIFLPDNFLLENLYRIQQLPIIMVQGRYDIACPIVTADEVAKHLPEAEYNIIPDAGHSAFDPSLCRELVKACEKMKTLIP
ncbi:prolyl aminopeptidase [Candidatus Odyssella acanthamoebae]|uniref:Proline iminopeptidase n=1 Tax=Candidatus Odyssella acanthamoebae TaxID=91604 RepID=A0A077B2F2_9PROT|nr:prolyl aminopeptidase [Candidatus Paracaedibacter acanthamoebae]AIK97175.1 proline iminopeptidase [Candidatus Paracaedibacter acanthamoebae]